MKYTCEITIDKPRDHVSTLFQSPDHIKDWQPSLIRMTPINGEPGANGSQSSLVYEERGGEVELIETIIDNRLPETFTARYESHAQGVDNIVVNHFTKLSPNSTRWVMECEFTFGSLVMRVIGNVMRGVFRKQTEKDMARFKAFAEKQPIIA